MQVALRKGNLDIVGEECLVDGAMQFMRYSSAVNGQRNPAEQFEIQA